jgi:transposase
MSQPHPAAVTPDIAATPIGVGIDTARYGHHATFLRPDLQPAAADLDFAESAEGYQQLRQRLDALVERFGAVHFHFRLDVAGAYADNLLAFLHTLGTRRAEAAPLALTISCGEPGRNKNYRVAVYGHKKSDPVESAAAARYALTEGPTATPLVAGQLLLLRQVAGRLEAQTRQCTRLVNQLHHLLARIFPELALITKDLATGWVLKLLERYPTAAKVAAARPASLEAIPYLPHDLIPTLQEQARTSIASVAGPVAEQLVRDQVRQVRQAQQRQQTLEKLLVTAYRQLPDDNHLASIKGIGDVTAAVLTAKIVAIDRFDTEAKLVGYFGTFPVEAASGIDRDGRRRPPRRYVMCQRGNDLVRRYLYLAALSAAQHNPAVRPLYQRVRAKHPDHPAVAVGHAMRKLLHLVFAVWKSGTPFNPQHYPWDQPNHLPASDTPLSAKGQAAGHNPVTEPEEQVVTAACTNTPPVAADAVAPQRTPAAPWLDFAHLKTQLPLARVLEHLGLMAGLRGRGSQRRGPCPVHASPGQGRTFSVHLDQNVFHCFEAACGSHGDVIDLWAAVKQLPLRDAAVDLVRTFGLEPAPPPPSGTEKRHG